MLVITLKLKNKIRVKPIEKDCCCNTFVFLFENSFLVKIPLRYLLITFLTQSMKTRTPYNVLYTKMTVGRFQKIATNKMYFRIFEIK